MKDLPVPTLPLANLSLLPRRRAASAVLGAAVLRQADQPAALRGAAGRAARAEARAELEVVWARHEDEVRAAQRLRYQVFVEEMGAQIKTPPGSPAGHDIDIFDPYCEHLLVRLADDPTQVIGTYRVLTPQAAKRVGGWYSDTEFDLTRVRPLQSRMAELGRSCVHPEHRTGGVILTLWGALAGFMARNGLETMIGCASIPMHDGGHAAASIWETLRKTHLAPIEHQVQPRLPLPVDDLQRDLPVEPPALVKGYLRCGAKVLGAPAWDPDFNTADLPLMLRLRDLPEKYGRHFMSA